MEISEKYFAIFPLMGSIFCLLYFFRILYFYKYPFKRWKTAIGIITKNEVKYKDVNGDGGWENSIEYTFNIGASIFVMIFFKKYWFPPLFKRCGRNKQKLPYR